MILWNTVVIAKGMRARGWTNARQLSKGAGIGYPAAWQIAQGGALGRIDVHTWEALATAFGVEPCALIEYVPD